MVDSASGASGAGASNAANNAANSAPDSAAQAAVDAKAQQAIDAAKTAAKAAAEAAKACNDPVAAQAAADRAKAAAEEAHAIAESLMNHDLVDPTDPTKANPAIEDTLTPYEGSQNASVAAMESARAAQAAADSAKASRCENVPMSQSRPTAPTSLALGTINQLGTMTVTGTTSTYADVAQNRS